DVKNLVFVELSDADVDEAYALAERYGISIEFARALILGRKVRARKLITDEEIPDELRVFEGIRVVNLEDETH
ncbi:MAG: hypothetical protein DRO90_02955, partial [Candidatus Altiarchaeales archaeon]